MSVIQSHDFFLQLHVTSRCNLRCSHCYQSEMHGVEMSLEQICMAVDEVSDTLSAWQEAYGLEFDVSSNVTGGEPLLRDDLAEILLHMKERGFSIYLLSNGTLVDRVKALELARIGLEGIQVSIEGPEAVHDGIRGAGNYRAAIAGVEALLGAGHSVAMNMTLSALNADDFFEMAHAAKDMGVHRFGFSRIVPYGSGRDLAQHMLLAEQVHELYKRISEHDFGEMRIVTGDPVASCMLFPDMTKNTGDIPLGGCAVGLSGVTFMPDGSILPCRRLPITLGNILTDSFREIWTSSEVLARIRDRSGYQGNCGSCHRWASCRGCRAIAYAHTLLSGEGDYLADDPQCFFPLTDDPE